MLFAGSNPVLSSGLILIAVIMDALDGIVARRYGSSDDGILYDTMGDIVSFSIAPSYLIYNYTTDLYVELGVIVSIIFMLASILHLRRYMRYQKPIGCQTTVAAIAISYGVYMSDPVIVVVCSILFSVLMLVNVQYTDDIRNDVKLGLGFIIFISVFVNYSGFQNPNVLNYPMILIILLYGLLVPLKKYLD